MEKDRVLELLKKLKNLSDNSRATTAEEASNAAIRMAELMLKYQISEKELEPEKKENVVQRLFEKTSRGAPDWKLELLGAVSDVNQCLCVLSNSQAPEGFYIIGREGNIQATIYVYHFILREMNKLLRKEKRILRKEKNMLEENGREIYWKWRMGFVRRLSALLGIQMKSVIKKTNGREIVKNMQAELTDFLIKHFGKADFIKPRLIDYDENYYRGEKAADKVSLRGISSTKPRLQTNRDLLN